MADSWGREPVRTSPTGRPLRKGAPTLKGFWSDEEDWRYFEISGAEFPVLLHSCRTKTTYQEDVDLPGEDDDPEWYDKLKAALEARGWAVLVWDHEPGQDWRVDGLFAISKVQLGNHLTCTIGERIARVREAA